MVLLVGHGVDVAWWAKVEHVFGCMVNEMGGKLLRSIGLERAKANLGLKNLTYNLKRLVMWESKKLAA